MQLSKEAVRNFENLYPGAVLFNNKHHAQLFHFNDHVVKVTRCPASIDWLLMAKRTPHPNMPRVFGFHLLKESTNQRVIAVEMEKLVPSFTGTAEPQVVQANHQFHAFKSALLQCIRELNHKVDKHLDDASFFKILAAQYPLEAVPAEWHEIAKRMQRIMLAYEGNVYPDITGQQQNYLYRQDSGEIVLFDPLATIRVKKPLYFKETLYRSYK